MNTLMITLMIALVITLLDKNARCPADVGALFGQDE